MPAATSTDTLQTDLQQYCLDVSQRAKAASAQLAALSTEVKNAWLLASAEQLIAQSDKIIAANGLDIAAAPEFGLSDAAVDRLRLDPERIAGIATGMREVAALPDPIGETIEGSVRPNGLEIRKVRVPLGTVFFIYESRPNVTADAAAICVKSGNAVILRGGKEARHSSIAIVNILAEAAAGAGVPENAVQIVETTDRSAVGHFLGLDEYIDVAIPRGGKGLIQRVASEAKMPVIKHYDGNCHVYIDASADPKMAVNIVVNSKCHRMGVCNAAEGIVVHRDAVACCLEPIAKALRQQNIEIVGDSTAQQVISCAAASDQDWSQEYLGPKISVRVVEDLQQAVEHINRYGSHHTDAIVTANLAAANQFCSAVDSSAVVVNASTRFNDGGQFGLGAEIGISTDKFHARGPCGLKELTTYKYIVTGNGQIRS